MNNQAIKIIVAVFITLAVIAAFPWIEKQIRSDKTDTKKNVSVNLSSFTKETTERIAFKKGDVETVLHVADNQWQVNNEPADNKKVELFFDSLQNMEIVRLASQNDENHKDLQVTKEDGITLTLTQNGKDAVYFIGKVGPQPDTFYIRKDGMKSVHLAQGAVRVRAAGDATTWKPEEEKTEKNETKDKMQTEEKNI